MSEIRTRFAPSPTGFMHIGNLRTALYSYLIAKNQGGKFILRIEDTDKERYVEGAVDVIYNTLKQAGLNWDEGPDIGGNYGPYIQSSRIGMYALYASQLVAQGDAYLCFCEKDSDECHCKDLTKEQIEKFLEDEKPYAIRQRIPKGINIEYEDKVFGKIVINSDILDDQILIKQDKYPTYNFANVIDDHLMGITDVVRGSEYISSTPKYILLYQAFGWEIPNYIHLPLINGKDPETGEISKLSKRHGSTSFSELIDSGYLSEAIINYIAFLGWNPKTNDEIFSLEDLIKNFKISGLHKSAAIFDYEKLNSINQYYISKMSDEDFYNYSLSDGFLYGHEDDLNWKNLHKGIKTKIKKFGDIYKELDFILEPDEYKFEDLLTYKNKTIDKKLACILLNEIKTIITNDLDHDEALKKLAEGYDVKFGLIVYLIRLTLSGRKNTIIGCYEIIDSIKNAEKIKRIDKAINGLETLN